MPTWVIEGANERTGREVKWENDAETSLAAQRRASGHGILVSEIRRSYSVCRDAKSAASALSVAATVMIVVGAIIAICALLALVAGLLASERPGTFGTGASFFGGLALCFGGFVARCLSAATAVLSEIGEDVIAARAFSDARAARAE